jgi:hypothetical protein
MFAAYVQGKAFLWPKTAGVESHKQGYLAGVKRLARLYWLVILLLGGAAVDEALEVIYLIPMFQ